MHQLTQTIEIIGYKAASLAVTKKERIFRLNKFNGSLVYTSEPLNLFSLKINRNTLITLSRNQSKKHYVFLRLNGLGFRAWLIKAHEAAIITFDLGYSHYYTIKLADCQAVVRKNKIFVFSANKESLDNLKNYIYTLKPLNPYTQKGIKIFAKKHLKKSRKKDRTR